MILTKKPGFFLIMLFIMVGITNTYAQDLNISGDTIYVNAEAEIMVRFPTLPTFFNTVPSNAPYNFKTAGTGFTIIAKTERSAPAPLFVTEGGRNHKFIIVFKKNIDYNNDAEMDYDFSTTKKIEQHIRYTASARLNEQKKSEPVKADEQKDKKTKKGKKEEVSVVNYYALLEEGDENLKKKDFAAAKQSFEKALALRPNDQIPKQRLEEVRLRIADQQKNTTDVKNKQYIDITNAAKASLNAKKYTQAQEGYKKALEIKPGDIYATHQLEKINELIKADSDKKDQLKLNDLYKSYIANGEKAFRKNDLAEARIAYEQALVIKPNDPVAAGKLKNIEDNEKKQKQGEKLETEYNNIIVTADKFYNAGDYEEAKVTYTKATGLSKKSWPQDQIKKINKIQADVLAKKKADEQKSLKLSEAKQKEILESNYNTAIKDGDKYFAAKDYGNATIAYNKALSIDKRAWPADQLKAIEKLLNQEAEEKRKIAALQESDKQAKERKKKEEKDNQAREKEYKAAIKDADKLFKNKDYQAAKVVYLKAGTLSKEKWPKEQITTIDKIIDEQIAKENAEKIRLAQEEVINGQYRSLINKAKVEFDKGNYISSRKLYVDAAKIKPAENLPKEKITLIQSTLDQLAIAEKNKKDSIANAAEIKKKYMLAISKGKSYFLKDDLENAKLAYTEASNIKPGESEPKTQLSVIQAKLDLLAKANEVDNVYDQKLATADSLLILKSYDQAISAYNAALKIKPDQYYPKKQINYITAEIKNDQKNKEELARLESYRKEEELEQKYRDALKRGKEAIAEQKYDVAKAAYTEVLTLRPGNEYALHMISVVNYQMEKANQAKVKNENIKKAEENKPVSTEKKDKEVNKPEKTTGDSETIKIATAPSNIAELKAKYPNIDFTNLPPEQPFNGEAVNTIEKSTIFKDILSESPRLNISTTESKVKLICQGINFEESSVYLKFLVQNNSKEDFLTGAMMLTWTKKSGNRIKLYPIYLYPAFLPVITPGSEATVIYVFKSYLISDNEKLNFELNDRLNKIKLQIDISGSKYNKEEERY